MNNNNNNKDQNIVLLFWKFVVSFWKVCYAY